MSDKRSQNGDAAKTLLSQGIKQMVKYYVKRDFKGNNQYNPNASKMMDTVNEIRDDSRCTPNRGEESHVSHARLNDSYLTNKS